MNENEFWRIMGVSKRNAGGSQDVQVEELKLLLSDLTLDEIESFDAIFEQCRRKAYTWDLWGAAYLLNGGCSDDGFEYFRWALIAEGQERFENAVRDPDSIADWAETDMEFEAIAYVAMNVYRDKSGGRDMPESKLPWGEPLGEHWEEDDLESRFPKIATLVA